MNKRGFTFQEVVYAVLALLVFIIVIINSPQLIKLFKLGLGYAFDKDSNKLAIDDSIKVLSPPKNVIAVPQQGKKIIISWLKSDSPNIQSYSVIRELTGNPPVNICDLPATTSQSYTCTDDKSDLEFGKKYIYTVIAYDANGEYAENKVEASPNR